MAIFYHSLRNSKRGLLRFTYSVSAEVAIEGFKLDEVVGNLHVNRIIMPAIKNKKEGSWL